MATIPTTETDTKTKIYNLTVELSEAEKDKKDLMKAHSENIKRIKAEIKEILAEEDEAVEASQKTDE